MVVSFGHAMMDIVMPVGGGFRVEIVLKLLGFKRTSAGDG
jgi:hypothetical protein